MRASMEVANLIAIEIDFKLKWYTRRAWLRASPTDYLYPVSKTYSFSIINNYFCVLDNSCFSRDYQNAITKNRIKKKSPTFRGDGGVFW